MCALAPVPAMLQVPAPRPGVLGAKSKPMAYFLQGNSRTLQLVTKVRLVSWYGGLLQAAGSCSYGVSPQCLCTWYKAGHISFSQCVCKVPC